MAGVGDFCPTSENDETNPTAASSLPPDKGGLRGVSSPRDDKPDKYPFDLSDIPLADPPPDLKREETNPMDRSEAANNTGDNMM